MPTMMRYIIRAVKYFLYLSAMVALILGVFILLKLVPPDPDQVFRGGWTSVMYIAILFGITSAFYPLWGYRKEELTLQEKPDVPIRDAILNLMQDMGYVLEKESGDSFSFILRNTFSRLTHSFEDRITFCHIGDTPASEGMPATQTWMIEGLTRDVVRISGSLKNRFYTRTTD